MHALSYQHLERNSRVLGCMPLVTSTWNVTVGCWDAKHISNLKSRCLAPCSIRAMLCESRTVFFPRDDGAWRGDVTLPRGLVRADEERLKINRLQGTVGQYRSVSAATQGPTQVSHTPTGPKNQQHKLPEEVQSFNKIE